MKKFILKSLIFVLPVLILYLVVRFFYDGDLQRVGFIMSAAAPRNFFPENYPEDLYFTCISDIDLHKKQKFRVLTLGDSFSEQGFYGYKNFLAKKKSIALLHYDRKLHYSPFQTLFGLLNGDFFDQVEVDCIILQSAERYTADRTRIINYDDTLNVASLEQKIARLKEGAKGDPVEEERERKHEFFSDRIIKVPLINILYRFEEKPMDSKTYRVKTSESLFTGKKNELLFFREDLDGVYTSEDFALIDSLNNILNLLSEKCGQKNIKLVFLPSPDKFDIYFDYILSDNYYPRPCFFEYLDSLPKDYVWLNSKKILSEMVIHQKDVYFYGDTHWSPLATEKIANELSKLIN